MMFEDAVTFGCTFGLFLGGGVFCVVSTGFGFVLSFQVSTGETKQSEWTFIP